MKRTLLFLLDLSGTMLPALVFLTACTYVAWASWWIR